MQKHETHKKQTDTERSSKLERQRPDESKATRRLHSFPPTQGERSTVERNTLPRVKFPPERTQIRDRTQLRDDKKCSAIFFFIHKTKIKRKYKRSCVGKRVVLNRALGELETRNVAVKRGQIRK